MRGLFKFILFVAFLAGMFYVRDAIIRSGIREQSLPFVEETLNAVTTGWNRTELDKRAEPALESRVTAVVARHQLDFPYFARLGKRVSDFACTLGDYTTFKDETQNYIAANYNCGVQFEKGAATLAIGIMREKETAPWRVNYFDVVSPYLAQTP